MAKKQDLRVQKTLMIIKRGFSEALAEKTFSDLTIQELMQYMMINKSTFYTYYADKYDLREQLIAETLQTLAASIDVSYLELDAGDFAQYKARLPEALKAIYGMRDWLLLLWSPNLESNFFERMEHLFITKITTSSVAQATTNYADLHARLFAASAMQVIKWWLEVHPETPVDEIAEIITNCLSVGTYVAFKA